MVVVVVVSLEDERSGHASQGIAKSVRCYDGNLESRSNQRHFNDQRVQRCTPGVTVCACMRFACVIRSGYLVLANQHTSSEGQGSRDLRQTRVEPKTSN